MLGQVLVSDIPGENKPFWRMKRWIVKIKERIFLQNVFYVFSKKNLFLSLHNFLSCCYGVVGGCQIFEMWLLWCSEWFLACARWIFTVTSQKSPPKSI